MNSIGPAEMIMWLLFGLPWTIIIALVWLALRLVMVKGFGSQSPKWALAGFWKRFLIVWAAITVIGGSVYALSLMGLKLEMFKGLGIILAVLAISAVGGAVVACVPALILRIWKAQADLRGKVFYTAWILSSLGVLVALMSESW